MGWIGVDFDGTLSEYHGFIGRCKFGPPVPVMLDRVKRWINEGKEVRIMTARAHDPKEIIGVQNWCEEHGLPRLEVTFVKDSSMIELWDDRAYRVEKNTGRNMSETPDYSHMMANQILNQRAELHKLNRAVERKNYSMRGLRAECARLKELLDANGIESKRELDSVAK
jgi:hypothetical protein